MRTGRVYNQTSAFASLLVWGSWAFFVNRGPSLTGTLISAIAQGLSSYFITLLMIRSLTMVFLRMPGPLLRWTVPTVVTMGLTLCGLVAIHALAGTTHILVTILPGWLGGVGFSLVTTYRLMRVRRRGLEASNPRDQQDPPSTVERPPHSG